MSSQKTEREKEMKKESQTAKRKDCDKEVYVCMLIHFYLLREQIILFCGFMFYLFSKIIFQKN